MRTVCITKRGEDVVADDYDDVDDGSLSTGYCCFHCYSQHFET